VAHVGLARLIHPWVEPVSPPGTDPKTDARGGVTEQPCAYGRRRVPHPSGRGSTAGGDAVHTRPVNGPVRLAASLVWLPVILLSAYLSEPPPAHQVPAAVAAVLGGLAWVVVAVRPDRPGWLDPTAIVVLAASGIGFLAAGGGWSSVLGFCFLAVVAAGTRLPGTAAVGVLVGTAVGVALVLRDAAHPTAIAIALLGLAGVLLLGMGRRESLRRTEQRELQLVNAARVQEEHARAAALAERTRIARDVHDVLAHSLSALAVQLQGARLMLLRDGAPADTVAQVERAQHLASEGLAEARRAVTALRTTPVDLADGLRALVADAPDATLEIDGAPDHLPATAQETVLRTAQEALTNARRHAAGAPVSVRLTTRDGATELEVRDRTGAPPPPAAGGYGLVGMAERAALAGADLSAGPVEDGWRVLLRLRR
jgi:signal transduction histidine kinase